MENIKRYISEFLGTFFLVLFGTGAIIINTVYTNSLGHLGVALCFGVVILVMIYACGHLSGAHFNPAITIAFAVYGKFEKKQVIPYIISQILGATAGSLFLRSVFGNIANMGATLPSFPLKVPSPNISFVFEIIFTACLAFVIMSVATDAKAEGSLAGVAIGLTVFMGAAVAGPVSGGSFNPARSIGPAIVSGNLNHLWIYIAGPVIGALVGLGCYLLAKSFVHQEQGQSVSK